MGTCNYRLCSSSSIIDSKNGHSWTSPNVSIESGTLFADSIEILSLYRTSWMSPCFDVIFLGAHSELGNPFKFFVAEFVIKLTL